VNSRSRSPLGFVRSCAEYAHEVARVFEQIGAVGGQRLQVVVAEVEFLRMELRLGDIAPRIADFSGQLGVLGHARLEFALGDALGGNQRCIHQRPLLTAIRLEGVLDAEQIRIADSSVLRTLSREAQQLPAQFGIQDQDFGNIEIAQRR